jgi:hypothetical protein
MCDLVHLSQGFFVAEQRTEADACIMDEESVACVTTKESRASTRIRHRQHDRDLFLYAFDLIEQTTTTCGTTRSRSATHQCA